MYPSNELREKLRVQLIENAAELQRLYRRIHETHVRQDESPEGRHEWYQACEEAHSRYAELWLPGGPYPNFLERLVAGEYEMVEVALCFLEVRPYFFRSGYHWKTIFQKCKRAPMSADQLERFKTIRQRYDEWRKLRKESSERGASVVRAILPLRTRFYDLFSASIADHKFDGVKTVRDLYKVLCGVLKIEPLEFPESVHGKAHKPFAMSFRNNETEWSKHYRSWREKRWRPEDVWETLIETIREVYKVDPSLSIFPEAVLIQDKEEPQS